MNIERIIEVLLTTILVIGLFLGSVASTGASFTQAEQSTDNVLRCWIATQWLQTSQADFEAGVPYQVDTAVNSGDVKLSETSDWYDSDWRYRKKITVYDTYIDADLNGFPFLLNLTSDSDLAAYAQDDGDDILFSSSDGVSRLSHEVEGDFNGTSGELVAWINADLTAAGDTELYMYFGHATCSSQQDIENVWDANYKMVQHLDESPDDDELGHLDSTRTDNDSTPKNFQDGGGGSTNATGKIGGADDLAGDDDWVDCGEGSGTLDIGTGDYTIEAWIKTTEANTRFIISKFHPFAMPPYGYAIQVRNNKLCTILCDGANHDLGDGNATINDDNWHFIAVSFDRDGNAIYYVDESIDKTVDISSFTGTTNNNMVANLGRRPGLLGPDEFFSGIIDEVRFSDMVRPPEWIKASYYNQWDPDNFYELETLENRYVPSGTLASQVLDTGAAGTNWYELSWTETLETDTDITFEVRASDTLFAKDAGTPSWSTVGGTSPVSSGLPSGRYMQWRATLTNSDAAETPILHDVSIYYY